MPKTSAPFASFVAAHADAIRTVPLAIVGDASTPTVDAARAKHTVPPHLTYRNGPLLTNVEVFTIFWGAAWQLKANAVVLGQVNQFFDYILSSRLIDQLAEYSVPGKSIGHGRHTGTLTITTPALGSSVTDSAIQNMLQQLISSGGSVPQPGPEEPSNNNLNTYPACAFHRASMR